MIDTLVLRKVNKNNISFMDILEFMFFFINMYNLVENDYKKIRLIKFEQCDPFIKKYLCYFKFWYFL